MATQSIENLLNESLQLQRAGKMLEARSSFRKILKKIPAHADALHFMGLTYIQAQEYEKGITYIQRSLTIKPRNAEAHYNLGNTWYEWQRFDEAIAAYRQAVSLKPEYWKAYNNLGNVLNLLKRHKEAIAQYQHALSIKADFAEAWNGMGVAYGEMQHFDEAVSAYQKAILHKPDFADACNNLGLVFSKLEQFDQATASFDKAIDIQPFYIDAHIGLARALKKLERFDDAVSHYIKALAIRRDIECAYELANILSELKRFDQALHYYQLVLSIRPDFIEAQNKLGIVLSQLLRFDEAVATFRKILDSNPADCDALNNLGNVLIELRKPTEAIECYQQALSIDPGLAESLNGLGNALKELNRPAEAATHYSQAIEIRPAYARAAWNRGLAYLAQGLFDLGWHAYEQRWELGATPPMLIPQPKWLGNEAISGKKLIVQFEQGYGDAIQMLRYVHLLERDDIECWLQCAQPLTQLVSRSFPHAHVIDSDIMPADIDYSIPSMSLPLAMKTFSEQSIPAALPYLIANADRRTYWMRNLAPAPTAKVGLVWRGNANHDNDRNRSAKIAHYIPLITGNPGIQFVALQKDLTQEEREILQSNSNVRIVDAELTDFDETAAIISSLDVVITIDSSPAHLSGALAIPTWILLPFVAEWRWMIDREDSPWYPTARLFRQAAAGDWNEVINRVNTELKKLGEKAYA